MVLMARQAGTTIQDSEHQTRNQRLRRVIQAIPLANHQFMTVVSIASKSITVWRGAEAMSQ